MDNMDGVQKVVVVDGIGSQLTDIVVIPLYQKSFVVAFGPDGKGYKSESRLTITKPFIFNSGENLMTKKIASKGIAFTLIYMGHNNYVDNWFFVKKGFVPKLARRSDIYSGTPILMNLTDGKENLRLIEALISPNQSQSLLRKLFDLDPSQEGYIDVVLDEKDMVLLRTLKE